ncbi:hypothetical protein SK128_004951 [Halocaridina rubra]|uniref:C-type lectin domain-containing protein n=1 Tax=Halocaridina rubra TaxID=373956 RepID=A0AAN8WUG0_HALRR
MATLQSIIIIVVVIGSVATDDINPYSSLMIEVQNSGEHIQIPDIGVASESKSENNTLPLDDVRAQVNSNALALSQLNAMLAQLLDYMSMHPPCSERAVYNHVAQAMKDGFNELPRAFRNILHSVNLLKLLHWRIDFLRANSIRNGNSTLACPMPFFMQNDECIYVETKARRSFLHAKMQCRAMGGYLAEPSSLEDLARSVSKMVMYGSVKEVFIGGTFDEASESWRWLSGGVIENIPWKDGVSPSHDNLQECLSIEERHYIDIPCTRTRHFVCERDVQDQ